MSDKKSENYWKEKLSPEQYRVLREKGTERAFTGLYYHEKASGIYCCGACGQELFDASVKYDSGSGWPSFYDVLHSKNLTLTEDESHGMTRIEVSCSQCGSHLGHLFDDGPQPTGKRYCVNSLSLKFNPRDPI